MDSSLALAIMVKAQQVFGRDDSVFLSFPLSPLAFPPEYFSFATLSGAPTSEQVLHLSEFSRIVNLIPEGMIWPPGTERRLWDLYDDVLRRATLAAPKLTSAERQQQRNATKFLYRQGPDGQRTDSPELRAYRRYRDASITAREDYNNKKIAADLADDAAVKLHWAQVEEPAARARIADLETDWLQKGSKLAVEDALRIVSAIAAKDPASSWAAYRTDFDKEIDLLRDTLDQPFAPTLFSPANALSKEAWQEFTLREAEAEKLIAEAPEELKKHLAADSVDLDIESLTFQYSSAGVTRSWLAADVFESRSWKLPNPGEVLCDGKTPPSGTCTSYVAGIVFGRYFSAVLRKASTRNAAAIARLTVKPTLSLGTFRITPKPVPSVNAESTLLVNAPPAVAVLPPAPVVHAAAPAIHLMATHLSPAVHAHTAALKVSALTALNFDRLTLIGKPPAAPPPAAQDDSVHVVALICKRLPRCPDPDPALEW